MSGDGRESKTSQLCTWVKPSKWKAENCKPVEVTALQTSLCDVSQDPQKRSDSQRHFNSRPDFNSFVEGIKKHQPEACMLACHFEQTNEDPVVNVPTPQQKLFDFSKSHTCKDNSCQCSHHFVSFLHYTKPQLTHIEQATRGQADNENWHQIRKFILTASNYKAICQSVNLENTAAKLLNPVRFEHQPAPISYGVRNEDKARRLFLMSHKMTHKQSKHKLHRLRREIGGIVDSESTLRSAGTFLSRVRAPPPAPRSDRGPESLRSPCGLAI
ncbi:shutoff alkaline exonuclease [Plakobranchus ocellatus]|uniref:Shutoff alkaline exonuclease n=1 Tax=Plakobranchus ocellatus TaxID=259542 RepID=A0AAV3YMY2_9GAST|nr:shutoff alkaline exonuclease [Plakobranchus ocellatus]